MNKAILCGNVGMDPELKDAGGTPCLRLRVATSERYKDKEGEWVDKPEWHSVIVWGNRATGLNKVLKKGHKVLVEGSIHTRSWEADGGTKYSTEIKAFNVELLERAPKTTQSNDEGW